MARFEVFVPSESLNQAVAVMLRVDAESWLAALKVGLDKLGSTQAATHVLCDVKPDGTLEVTDPSTGRFFQIRELAGEATEQASPERGTSSSEAARVVEATGPSASVPAQIGRRVQSHATGDLPAELGEQAALARGMGDRDRALGHLLDLAMQYVKCESGSVFVRLPEDALGFAVVRGPKAQELLALDVRVPVGIGVVGFCAQENVALAVSDVEQDPRFFRAISAALGYPTHSLLCVPVAHGGKVLGALELVNKLGRAPFDGADLVVLTYLAGQAGQVIGALAR